MASSSSTLMAPTKPARQDSESTPMDPTRHTQPTGKCGLLLIYRWEPKTDFKHIEPDLFQGFNDLACDVNRSRLTMLSIFRGNDRGKAKDQWSPEVRSGIAALYLSRLEDRELAQLESVFQQPTQYHGIRHCRYWDDTPSSTMAWLSGHEEITFQSTNRGLIRDLRDLIRHRCDRVIDAIQRCVKAREEIPERGTALRRRRADLEQADAAVLAVNPQPTATRNALSRSILPCTHSSNLVNPDGDFVPIRSFAEVISDTTDVVNTVPVRPGFQMSHPDTETKSPMRLLLHEIAINTIKTIRAGTVQCPRAAFLRPVLTAENSVISKGSGKRRKICPTIDNTKIIFHKNKRQLGAELPYGQGKHSAIWIASYSTVQAWIRERASGTGGFSHPASKNLPDDVYLLGKVHLVTGAMANGQQCTVKPQVKSLITCNNVEKDINQQEPTLVMTLLLDDLHDTCFAYESLRAEFNRVDFIPLMDTDPTMRMALGLEAQTDGRNSTRSGCAIVLQRLCGCPQSPARQEFLAYTSKMLNKTWSHSQQALLLNASSEVLISDSAPGAGKSTLIQAFLLQVLRNDQPDLSRIKIIVAAPNKSLAKDTLQGIQTNAEKAGLKCRATRIGLDEEASANEYAQDHLEKYLKECIDTELMPNQELLQVIDYLIDAARQILELCNEPQHIDKTIVKRVALAGMVVRLLTVRHLYLDLKYYKNLEEARAKAIGNIKIIIGTPAKILEGRAGLATWTRLIDKEDLVMVMVDEYQQPPFQNVLALAAGSSFLLCTGDTEQRRSGQRIHRDSGTINILGTSEGGRTPLDHQGAPQWFEQNDFVQKLALNDTMRLGPSAIRLLQQMWPGRHDHIQTGRSHPHDTMCFPVVFGRLTDWFYDEKTKYIRMSTTYLAHTSVILAMELYHLLLNVRPQKKGVLVISFLKSFLQPANRVFKDTVPALCISIYMEACARSGRPSDPDFLKKVHWFEWDWMVAQGYVTLTPPLRAGGGDSFATLLCVPNRKRDDWSWSGDAIQRHLMFIGLTRASNRLYVLLENLTDGVVCPNGDQWRGARRAETQEAINLGVNNFNYFKHTCGYSNKELTDQQVHFKNRMPWVRLIDHSKQHMYEDLGVSNFDLREINTEDFSAAPIFYSQKLKHAMTGEPKACSFEIWWLNKLTQQAATITTQAKWWKEQNTDNSVIQPDTSESSDFLRESRSQSVTCDTAFRDWRYLSHALRSNPDCAAHATLQKQTWDTDVVAKYAISGEATDFDTFFNGAHFEWQRVAMDSMCVHIHSDKEINVTIPVAVSLLFQDWKWKHAEESRNNDAHELCRILSERAFEFFESTRICCDIQKKGGTVQLKVGRHKKTTVDLGDTQAVIAEANSDRPYFGIQVTDPPNATKDTPIKTEWSHTYTAMGLPHAHELQQTILARCYNIDIAACYVSAASELLGMRLRRSSVACFKEDTDALFFSRCEEHGVRVADDTLPKLIDDIDPTLLRQAAQPDGDSECHQVLDYLCCRQTGHLFILNQDE